MKWTKVKDETPSSGQYVLGVLARGTVEDHKRLVRVMFANIPSTRSAWAMIRYDKYWRASDGRRLSLDEISHWAPIELPKETGIERLAIGDRVYRIGSEDMYIVADTDHKKVALVNLRYGTRWSQPRAVCCNTNITGQELDGLFGTGRFERI